MGGPEELYRAYLGGSLGLGCCSNDLLQGLTGLKLAAQLQLRRLPYRGDVLMESLLSSLPRQLLRLEAKLRNSYIIVQLRM